MSGYMRTRAEAVRDGALRVSAESGRDIERSLALPNKAYSVAVRMREAGKRMPLPAETLSPCVYMGDELACPRRVAWSGSVEDATILPAAPRLTTSLALRGYQRAALLPWWRGGRNGVIEAPCGSGKTAIGLAAIAACETPALVLVHTRDLLRQWADRATAIGIRADTVSEGASPVAGRVVIATMQTAALWSPRERGAWGGGFGLVVVDEAHHVPCDTLGTVLYDLPARWRLGLTATPDRSDGLTPWLHAHLGPTVATVERAALVRAGVVLAPTVRPVRTEWAPGERDDHAAMMEGATTDEGRLDLVVRLAARLAMQGRHVLVQTERVGHAEAVASGVAALGVEAAAVHAKLSGKERVRRLGACASGELRVLCATQLADEGLDMPSLDALILAVPQRNPGRLEQRVGRVSRSAPGKAAADVYDLVDGGWAGKLWWARRRVYQRLGCAIADEVRGA